MKMLRLLFVPLLTASAALAQGSFDRTIPVPSQADLYVATGSGYIHIHPGDGTQVHVTAHLRSGWHAGGDVQTRIQQIIANPPVQVQGKTVRIGDTEGKNPGLYNNINIDYDIAAPASIALNLRTGSGDIETNSLGRFAKAETGSGSIRVRGLSGPADLHTGSGDVELDERAAANVRAGSGSGSVRVSGVNGSAELRTGSGDLELSGQITGPSSFQDGSGSIRLHLGPAARFNLDATTGSGSIRVAQPGAPQSGDEGHHLSAAINGGGPPIKAVTGSGDIDIN